MKDLSPVWAGKPLSLTHLRQGFARNDFWPSLPTALLCWFLTVLFSVSLAALIFHGPLEAYLSLGITMSLLTATTVGLVITLLGSLPGTIAIPSDRTAPMLAILTGSVAATFSSGQPDDEMIQTCLATLILTTFLTGVLLALLGHYRLGRLIRFLPFPVVGGFMAGAGWLLVKGALIVLAGFDPNLANISELFASATLLKWMPALAMALLLVIATRRFRYFLVIPTIVMGSILLFYAIACLNHANLAQLRALEWLPGPFPKTLNWQPPSFHLLFDTDWSKIFLHGSTIGTILLVSATSVLMISSALEVTASTEVEADQELEAAGLANLAAVFCGGLVGFHSLSITSLALKIGPQSRWIGLFTAAGCGLTLLIGPNLVSYLPIPVLGGLLLYLGLNFLAEWLIDSRRRMPRSDYLIIVLILVVVAWAGYLVGVGVGLVMAVVLFALRYSRIDIVRMELDGHQHRSNVDRTEEEQEILRPLRPSILILKLQGFIFFGTAHSLLHRVRMRAHAASLPPLKYLFMDFRHVTGLDSSTLLSFSKLLQTSRQLDFKIIVANLPPRYSSGLATRSRALRGKWIRPATRHGSWDGMVRDPHP